jgi:putative ABC transport system permease protein
VLVRLLPYHLHLGLKSLLRDRGLSATIVIVLAVAAGIFATGTMHFLRIFGPRPPSSPALHQVEIASANQTLLRAFAGTTASANDTAARTRVSYPDYQVLAASGIPARATATFRARALVGPENDSPAAAGPPLPPPAETPDGPTRVRNARFVNGDFFALFGRRFRWGQGWSAAEEAAGARVVVVGKLLNRDLFAGGNSVGAHLRIDGRRYRIVGVLAEDQPFVTEWDRTAAGGGQDKVYLPFAEHQRLAIYPETALYNTPVGPRYRQFLQSDAIFVSYWVELPTAAGRAAYARYLDDTLSRRGIGFTLRSRDEVRRAFPMPASQIGFFALVTVIFLVCGGLVMARLLLAKGLARADELGIFRAVGASRWALFMRGLIEAGMLASAAAVLSIGIAILHAYVYNRAVGDTDIPVSLTVPGVAVTLLATEVIGLLAAIYPAWRAAGRRPTVALGRT